MADPLFHELAVFRSTGERGLHADKTATMPVPFETLIPYGIIIAMFGVTGAGLSKIKNMQSGGKRHRWSIDQWDRQSTLLPLSWR
ncbi:hypothetical protein VTH06DRAFT_7108 [Thermothelomyces fergusii]